MRVSRSPLRIACFGVVQLDSGSVASAHHRLLASLVGRGHDVEFFAAEGYLPDPGITGRGTFTFRPFTLTEPAWLDRLGRLGIEPITRLRGLRWTWQARRRVRDLINDRTDRSDVALVLGTAPPRGLRVPVVSWPQGLPGGELGVLRQRRRLIVRISGWREYLPVRIYYEAASLFQSRRFVGWTIVASEESRAELIRTGHAPARVATVPYAIDLERFRPPVVEINAVPGPRRILCLGRLDPRKRIDLLVEATAILAARRADFEVEVIGRPGYARGWAELVERAASELPISYRQAIPQSEAAERLAGADLMVQPSEREEFGHAVAEALACGTPVVLGPTNRTAEYLDRATGTRFAEYTPTALADALEQWLDAPRGGSASACRAVAERLFSQDAVAGAVENVLHEATASSAVPSG